MLAIYKFTNKDGNQTCADEEILAAWLLNNKVTEAKWYRDPDDPSQLAFSTTFEDLVRDVEAGNIGEILSLELWSQIEIAAKLGHKVTRLLAGSGSAFSPNSPTKLFEEIKRTIGIDLANYNGDERGKKIREGLQKRKEAGKPLGAKKGNKHRLGKMIPPDPEILSKIQNTVGHTDKQIASRLGLSPSCICKYRKKFLKNIA